MRKNSKTIRNRAKKIFKWFFLFQLFFLSIKNFAQAQPLSVQTSHTNPTCTGVADGSITAMGINGTPPYTYRINNGAFTGNNVFSNLNAGIYTISVKDNLQAQADTTIELIALPGSLTVRGDTSICTGSSVTLFASGADLYQWSASPADSTLITPNIAAPVVMPGVTTVYTVSSSTLGANLLTNPSFENGNAGFTTDYTFTTTSTFNAQTYSISANPQNQNSFFTNCGDHTTGTGNMMVVDGGLSTTAKLWSQTVSVIPNSTYTYTYWIQTVSNDANGDGHPAGIDARINGISIGLGIEPTFGLPCGNWQRKSFTWFSGTATSAEITIYDTTTVPNGNDFALDDLSFSTDCIFTKNVTVAVAPCIIPLSVQASHTDAGCNGAGGTITVNGQNGMAPYSYSINGGQFTGNNVFDFLSPASYLISVRDSATPATQIDTTIVILEGAAPVTVRNDTAICQGSTVMLSVNGGSVYLWSAVPEDTSLTTPAIANPVVMPLVTTVYTVTSGNPASNNLISNPDFENGNTGFASEYTYTTNSTFNSQTYSIRRDPSGQNSFFTNCGDHTTSTGNMMVVDGGLSTTAKLWSQTIPVFPNSTYTYSYWIQTVSNDANGDGHPAGIDTRINGNSIGLGIEPTFGLPCGNWQQKSYTWFSGAATSAEIIIYDTTTAPNGNDFAIDDISFKTAGCSASKSVTVTVNPPTPAPTANAVIYCQNASAVPLSVTGSGLMWYTSQTGGQGTSIAPIPSTAMVGMNTYYVSQTGQQCGESARTPVVVTTVENPMVYAGRDTTIFFGETITLTGTSNLTNGSYLWTPSGSTTLTSQVSPQVQTTYTLEVTNNINNCKSSDQITVSINPGNCLDVRRIFTPNKDGHNDLWIIYKSNCYKQVNVNVYNRWGGLVYHKDDYINDWDGSRQGQPLPDATYYYIIEVIERTGKQYQVKGNVTIMR